jgi:hypothetical protein
VFIVAICSVESETGLNEAITIVCRWIFDFMRGQQADRMKQSRPGNSIKEQNHFFILQQWLINNLPSPFFQIRPFDGGLASFLLACSLIENSRAWYETWKV